MQSNDHPPTTLTTRRIAIDGVFFQLYQTGIARVWRSLLQEWVGTEFGDRLLILDRVGTAPRIPGLNYRDIPPHDYNRLADDRQMLQAVCDEEGIDLFISTYYTTPLTTPSVLLSHDMIPEVLEWNLAEPMWQEKDNAIRYASAHLAVSHNTARDLHHFYPNIPLESIVIAHNGIGSEFTPVNPFEVRQWRDRYGIDKPYFLLVGSNGSYKNPELFFQAFSQLATKSAFDVVCTGMQQLSPQIRDLTAGSAVHCLRLTDRELAAAYSGAIALVYPSRYEGFGMPVAEAMACNCPTIVCPTSSLPEVAGDAAIYVEPDDISSMVAALCRVQNNLERQEMCAKGYTRSRQFSWENMANIICETLSNVPLLPFQLQEENYLFSPDWQADPDLIAAAFYKAFLLLNDNDRPATTLLVDTSAASDSEEVELWLAGLMMEWFDEGIEGMQLELACFNEFQHDRAKIQSQLTGIITPILTEGEVDIKVTSIDQTDDTASRVKGKQFTIGQCEIILPYNHPLDRYQQSYPRYDRALGYIARLVADKYPNLGAIDIGANVGDSAALINSERDLPVLCIEGNPEFLPYLECNSKLLSNIAIAPYFVGSDDRYVAKEQIDTHRGTATIQEIDERQDGKGIAMKSLQSIVSEYETFRNAKLLKVDTDGYDFKIVSSSIDFIANTKPVLFFEYDIAFQKNDCLDAKSTMTALLNAGYDRFVIYDNFGNYLHSLIQPNTDRIDDLNAYLVANRFQTRNPAIYYYDICAFSEEDSDLFAALRNRELNLASLDNN
jgi:FkbM family methyltransferase